MEFAAKIMQKQRKAQRIPAFSGNRTISRIWWCSFKPVTEMENALPAVCAQKDARQVPFRWTIEDDR